MKKTLDFATTKTFLSTAAIISTATLNLTLFSSIATASQVANDVFYYPIDRIFEITSPTFTSVQSGSFVGNVARVAPGSTLSLSGNYNISQGDTSYCPTCIIQAYTAWISPAPIDSQGFWSGLITPSGIYNDIGSNPGTFNWTTTAPTEPGDYFIGIDFSLDYQFNPNRVGSFGKTSTGTEAAPFKVTVEETKSVPEPFTFVGTFIAGTLLFCRKRQVITQKKS